MSRTEPFLQRKLLVWLLGPLGLLLVLAAGFAYWNSQRFAHIVYDRLLAEVAREIVLHVKVAGNRPQLDISEAASQVLLQDQDDLLFYRVYAEDGAPLGGDADMPQPKSRADGQAQFYDAVVRERPVRMMSSWHTVGGSRSARVQVQVAETLNKRSRLAWEMVANAVVPQLLLMLLAGTVVWLGVSRGLKPLQRLSSAVSNRSHRDLSPIDTQNVPGEVRPLVDEVNQLMQRLGGAFDFQNRFVADAAHQLKTPVSGLKAQIEMALRESDLERVRHSLAQLYISADRLSRLVQQLLSLARHEAGSLAAMQLQPLDLNALALEVGMEWVPEAIKRNIDLGFEGSEQPLMINADRDWLRELINNLIDNAIRYSQAGGRVTVRANKGIPGQCLLSVSDDGPSIPVPERKRIFERFHRLLGTQQDGSGLGLAIVNEIATRHGANITLEEDIDGIGNTFKVHFPLRSADAGL